MSNHTPSLASISSCSEKVDVIDDNEQQTATVQERHDVDNEKMAPLSSSSSSSAASEKEPTVFDMIKKKAAESAVRAGLGYLFASLNYLKNKVMGTQEEDDNKNIDDDDVVGDAAQELLDEIHGDGVQEVSNVAPSPQCTPTGPV
jgi:hypothetical protein